MIAEVGVWNSPHIEDSGKRMEARERCLEQFRLAEYVKARCCVNLSGAAGQDWYGCYPGNYSQRLYEENVEFVCWLCDTVKPEHTFYTFEPMQWMLPDSPEQYLKFMKEVDRRAFAVHLDAINWVNSPYAYIHNEEMIHQSYDLLGPYIKSIHIKDCKMQGGTTVIINEVPVGEGAFKLKTYLERASQLKEDVPVLIEHMPDMDAYDRARIHIRSLGY